MENLRKKLAADNKIAIVWGVEDVQSVRPDLNDDDAMAVLQECQYRHDASIGLNWEVIRTIADMTFPPPKE